MRRNRCKINVFHRQIIWRNCLEIAHISTAFVSTNNGESALHGETDIAMRSKLQTIIKECKKENTTSSRDMKEKYV